MANSVFIGWGGTTVVGPTTFTGPILLPDGTAAAPSLAFASDTDTGLYLIGANNIGIGVNGAKVLDISTTGLGVTGKVSIGTNPSTSGAINLANAAWMHARNAANTGDVYLARIGTDNLLELGVGTVHNGSMKPYAANVLDIGTVALTFRSAYFGSAIAIGNTVGAGVAVASTHKVTMVIGGVTYYLLASNV